jgi:hypothetical protein
MATDLQQKSLRIKLHQALGLAQVDISSLAKGEIGRLLGYQQRGIGFIQDNRSPAKRLAEAWGMKREWQGKIVSERAIGSQLTWKIERTPVPVFSEHIWEELPSSHRATVEDFLRRGENPPAALMTWAYLVEAAPRTATHPKKFRLSELSITPVVIRLCG